MREKNRSLRVNQCIKTKKKEQSWKQKLESPRNCEKMKCYLAKISRTHRFLICMHIRIWMKKKLAARISIYALFSIVIFSALPSSYTSKTQLADQTCDFPLYFYPKWTNTIKKQTRQHFFKCIILLLFLHFMLDSLFLSTHSFYTSIQ